MADRITVGTGATIVPHESGGEPNAVAERNALSRVYLEDGETFEVITRISGGEEVVHASGTAKAVAGKFCSIYVKVRGEADVEKPVEYA